MQPVRPTANRMHACASLHHYRTSVKPPSLSASSLARKIFAVLYVLSTFRTSISVRSKPDKPCMSTARLEDFLTSLLCQPETTTAVVIKVKLSTLMATM